jgi:hypothetical protein
VRIDESTRFFFGRRATLVITAHSDKVAEVIAAMRVLALYDEKNRCSNEFATPLSEEYVEEQDKKVGTVSRQIQQ